MGKPTRKGVQNRLENHFEENNYPWFAVKGCIKWVPQRSLLAWYYSLQVNQKGLWLSNCTLSAPGKD